MSLNGVFIPAARTARLRPHRTGRRQEHPKSDSDLADGDGQSCSAEARSTHERGSPTRRGARIRRQDNGQVEHDQGGRHRRRRQARRTSWTDTGKSRTRNEDRADTHAGRRCGRMSGVDPLKDQHDAGAREPQLDDRPAAERSTESPNRSSSTGVSQPGSHRGRQLARPAAYRFGPANLGRIAPRPRPEADDNANADVSKIKPKVESTGSAPPRSRNDSGATVEGDGRRRRIESRTTPPGRPNSIARSTATAAPARQSPKRRARVPDKRQSCDARNAVS